MATGSHLTYKITGTATASDPHNVQISLESEPTGDTGEMYPSKEKASTTTILAPKFTSKPTVTLHSSGEETVASGTVIGEEITTNYQWERCQLSICEAIAGATGTTYHVTVADGEHELRVAETAKNGGGEVKEESNEAGAPPVEVATASMPYGAEHVNSRAAKFEFETVGPEPPGMTYECKLRYAFNSWTSCTSPKEYTHLANEHDFFEVRANYGGLTTTPASQGFWQWTVEVPPPPTPTFVTKPAEHSASATAKFKIGELVSEGTVECDLDGAGWSACAETKEYSGLGEGAHNLAVRQKNKEGETSGTAEYGWRVEVAPPKKPTITPGHASPTLSNHESFTFGELFEGGKNFECRLDSGAWGACSSLKEFSGLADGKHRVEARQHNNAGVESEVASYEWTVEATPPPAPTITSAPSSPSSVTNPTFRFGNLVEGDKLECNIDGKGWKECGSSTEFAGLANGEHTVQVRQVNIAGAESEVTTYKWMIDTTPPPPPVTVSGPEAETTLHAGHFEFSHEPGTTVECALDGGPFGPCTSGLTVSELPEGWHALLVRQVSTAGVPSPTASYRWHIGAKAAPKPPSVLAAKLAARATVSDNRSVNVGCTLNGGSLRVCTVSAYHYIHHRWVFVGRGRLTLAGGHTSGVVHVVLNARGRRLLVAHLGGLGVRLKVRGETSTGSWLRAHYLHARLLAQHVLIIPIVWPFETERTRLVGQARRIVEGAAREIRDARTVTCIGNTDGEGNASYNVALGLRRARTVCRTLRELGVHASFKVETRGKSRPRATNETARGRALNRRVELRVAY